ncbi:hypothetical protein LTR84_011932 [Exophiala bonariae]|uniref:Alpha/beta hydrolase fold-3 domain-containing protein n=1 Tax=Exophiala bonariae TaxID=1690606 RepID=A0AAV9MRU0_9EURO|nr:hypothetical protein LTR84_011932 [Exophiala bonariae]
MSVDDSSTWANFGKIDPELETILGVAGPQPSLGDLPDVPTLRQAFLDTLAHIVASGHGVPPDLTGVKKSSIQIPVRDGTTISSLLYQPEHLPAGGSPLIVLYHGGGFCIGMPELEEDVAVTAVRNHGAIALSVDYRMAPEFIFPVAIHDCFDTFKWAAANAQSLNADLSQGFLLGGSSSGATAACSVAHLARDEKVSPPLTGMWYVRLESETLP